MKSAGLSGSPVTVWTNTKDPRPAIGAYLASVLNQIGFKASIKSLNQTVYFSTIGDPKSKAQIGFDDWFQDFPHPGDFMGNLLTTAAAKSIPSFNSGFVSDPHVDSQVNSLDAQQPPDVASGWAALDAYVNRHGARVLGAVRERGGHGVLLEPDERRPVLGLPEPGASGRLGVALPEVSTAMVNGRALRRPPDRPMDCQIDHIIARYGH